MYSNNILNFQKSTTILNACTKKVWKLIECPRILDNCPDVKQNSMYKNVIKLIPGFMDFEI